MILGIIFHLFGFPGWWFLVIRVLLHLRLDFLQVGQVAAYPAARVFVSIFELHYRKNRNRFLRQYLLTLPLSFVERVVWLVKIFFVKILQSALHLPVFMSIGWLVAHFLLSSSHVCAESSLNLFHCRLNDLKGPHNFPASSRRDLPALLIQCNGSAPACSKYVSHFGMNASESSWLSPENSGSGGVGAFRALIINLRSWIEMVERADLAVYWLYDGLTGFLSCVYWRCLGFPCFRVWEPPDFAVHFRKWWVGCCELGSSSLAAFYFLVSVESWLVF